MERIKLAIERAKDSAAQELQEAGRPVDRSHRRTQGRRPVGASEGAAKTPGASRSLAPFVTLLLGMALMGALWVATGQKNDRGAESGVAQNVSPLPAERVETPPPAAVAAVTAAAPTSPMPTPPAPIETEASTEALSAQVGEAVEAWRTAWTSRDMAAYLGAYSDSFVPADGITREAWLAGRYRNVGGRGSIEVSIRDVGVDVLSPDRARVDFIQDYVSGGYQELNRPKSLDMVREGDGRWRIVREWLRKAGATR